MILVNHIEINVVLYSRVVSCFTCVVSRYTRVVSCSTRVALRYTRVALVLSRVVLCCYSCSFLN